MGLIEELRETAAFAHRVTGCSLKKHSCTKAANEIERLREWIRDSGQVTDTCTRRVLCEICTNCKCSFGALQR